MLIADIAKLQWNGKFTLDTGSYCILDLDGFQG